MLELLILRRIKSHLDSFLNLPQNLRPASQEAISYNDNIYVALLKEMMNLSSRLGGQWPFAPQIHIHMWKGYTLIFYLIVLSVVL